MASLGMRGVTCSGGHGRSATRAAQPGGFIVIPPTDRGRLTGGRLPSRRSPFREWERTPARTLPVRSRSLPPPGQSRNGLLWAENTSLWARL